MTALARQNRKVAMLAGLFALAMIVLGFASVPLYRAFCQATGFNGTTQRAEGDAPGAVVGKIVNVRFDANIDPGMGWTFRPAQTVTRTAVGARQLAFFEAVNTTDHPITGRATYNVTPVQAGQYFDKIQCFCFNEQTLKPGERVRMPVVFYVDPKLLDDADARDISEITLSYTFFPVDSGKVTG
jgi:cytochrome c oxidase assembly protein subunit 11